MLPEYVAVRLRASVVTWSQFTPSLSDNFSIKVLIFPGLTSVQPAIRYESEYTQGRFG